MTNETVDSPVAQAEPVKEPTKSTETVSAVPQTPSIADKLFMATNAQLQRIYEALNEFEESECWLWLDAVDTYLQVQRLRHAVEDHLADRGLLEEEDTEE